MLRIHRSTRNGPYADEDVRKLGIVVPSLSRAARSYSDQVDLAQKTTLALAALDQLQIGVLVISSRRHVLQMNAAAQNLLNTDDATLIVREGKLVARDVTADAVLRLMIERAHNARASKSQIGALGHCCDRFGAYRVVVSPLGCEFSSPSAGDTILITLERLETRPSELSGLKEIYGLTLSEAAIAQQIVERRTPRQIAAQNSVSINTVKTHLKSIFAKMRISSQSDLVRVVLSPPGLNR